MLGQTEAIPADVRESIAACIRKAIESRSPDIAVRQNVRFLSHGASNRVAQAQLRTWEVGICLVEFLAQRCDGTRAMRRALRAKVTRNSVWVTSRSAALATADWIRVRPSSPALR